jgi:hypothetical protein
MNLLIHADPGARSGFLAAWLTNKLDKLSFDSGVELQPQFKKIHNLNNYDEIQSFRGVKIRIKPTLDSIDLHSLLFLRKNVHVQIPEFTKDEYSLDTFTKLTHWSYDIFQWDSELDYNLYDIVLTFNDTFDNEYMQELYKKIVGAPATNFMIDILKQTNNINQISIDKNHACSILKLVLTKEHNLKLKEEHRFWSIVDIYNNTPNDQLYDAVNASIKQENYGILLS